MYNLYLKLYQIAQVKFQIDNNQMIIKVLEIDDSCIN